MKKNNKSSLLILPTFIAIWMAFSNIALAYYFDEESSFNNLVQAASLDMKVSSASDGFQEESDAMNFKINQSLQREISVENIGSLEFQYIINYQKESGDNNLCENLELTAKKNDQTVFEGALDELSHASSGLATLSSDNWKFEIALPEDADESLENLECNFNFNFVAWQTNFPNDTQGWKDTAIASNNEIHTGDWMGPEISSLIISDPINIFGDGNDLRVNISWNTNELSTTNIVYDIENHSNVGNYQFASPNPADTLANLDEHALVLAGLEMSKTYYFRILSEDQYGNERISDEYSFEISSPADSSPGTIVLNEFIPNPKGSDNMSMPNGEWIELFNNSTTDINVAGWYITDASGHDLYIHAENCDNNSDTNDAGETIVPAGGHLVVYDDNSSFSLNNDGDTIELFNNNFTPADQSDDISMDTATYGSTPEEKTIARFPDGIGPWVDPDGTPGKNNKLSKKEIEELQAYTFNTCFGGEKLDLITTDPLCNPYFLVYIEMLEEVNSRKLQQEQFIEKDESNERTSKKKRTPTAISTVSTNIEKTENNEAENNPGKSQDEPTNDPVKITHEITNNYSVSMTIEKEDSCKDNSNQIEVDTSESITELN